VSEPSVLVASERAYGLAEGPLWDGARERVLWVDINAGEVFAGSLRGGVIDDAAPLVGFDETVGAVVCAQNGQLLVAGARSVFTPGDPGGATTLFEASKNSRLNDGGCDPAGRFLVGSMALDDREGEECLYRIELDGSVTIIDQDLTLSNGLAWSPDGSVLYTVDTTPGIVYARPYDPGSSGCGERTVALRLAHDGKSPGGDSLEESAGADSSGSPDGLCTDAAGNLWIAIWGAGQVRCYTPGGELVATVQVPAPHVTSVAFIGPELDTLLITSAHEDESRNAGRLFTASVGARGTPTTPWAGVGR
jgi:sugar lactone lactonase YvrE